MDNQNNLKKENKALTVIFWIISIFILLIGFLILFTYPIVGITWFLIGVLILPPISKIVKEKLKINLAIKIVVIIVLFIISMFGIPEDKYSRAFEFYESEKFEEAIKKLNQIKPKNDEERKKVNELKEFYAGEKKLYEADKNKYFFDNGMKYYKDKAYEKAITILSKVENNSLYYKNANILISKYNYDKQKEADKKNYDEANKLFENNKYSEAKENIKRISEKTEYFKMGKILENKVNIKIAEEEKKNTVESTKVTEQKEETAVKEYKINDIVDLKNFLYRVNNINYYKTIGNDLYSETADGVFLVINISIKNKSSETKTLDNSLFDLYDSNNNKYSYSTEGSTALEMSGSETVFLKQCQPNIQTSGNLIYEVPASNSIYYIEVNDGSFFSDTVKIRLKY